MPVNKMSNLEKIVLLFIFIMVVIGFALFQADLPSFLIYIEEDGIVEWLTVLGLMLGFVVCIQRLIKLGKLKTKWFIFTTVCLALLLFFASGEEISWGQRIFGIKSSEFFKDNNAQAETNFHNLIVDGVKLNKIIFSIGLTICMIIYLLFFPVLYRSNEAFKSFANRWGVPIAQLYQVISIGVLYGLTETIRHGKRAELLEAGIAILFFLIIRYPLNRRTFTKNG